MFLRFLNYNIFEFKFKGNENISQHTGSQNNNSVEDSFCKIQAVHSAGALTQFRSATIRGVPKSLETKIDNKGFEFRIHCLKQHFNRKQLQR